MTKKIILKDHSFRQGNSDFLSENELVIGKFSYLSGGNFDLEADYKHKKSLIKEIHFYDSTSNKELFLIDYHKINSPDCPDFYIPKDMIENIVLKKSLDFSLKNKIFLFKSENYISSINDLYIDINLIEGFNATKDLKKYYSSDVKDLEDCNKLNGIRVYSCCEVNLTSDSGTIYFFHKKEFIEILLLRDDYILESKKHLNNFLDNTKILFNDLSKGTNSELFNSMFDLQSSIENYRPLGTSFSGKLISNSSELDKIFIGINESNKRKIMKKLNNLYK